MAARRFGILFLVGMALVALGGCMLFQRTTASIELTTLSGVVPLTVGYSANASDGPGGIDSWHWEFEEGIDIYEASGEYTFAHAGTYEIELTVRASDGSMATESAVVNVEPAFWVADSNLAKVYKLDSSGSVLATLETPGALPEGLALVETGGQWDLYVACQGNGVQRIYCMDTVTGDSLGEFRAPAQSPAYLAYGALAPYRLWHVDLLSRQIYEFSLPSGQFINSFGATYFQSSPNLGSAPFLQTPAGLSWSAVGSITGSLWLLEAETRSVYQLRIDPPINIFESIQLELQADPIVLDASVFPVAGMDWYEDSLWVVSRDHHSVVEIDPETGLPTGREITGFPGASVSGLAIQY